MKYLSAHYHKNALFHKIYVDVLLTHNGRFMSDYTNYWGKSDSCQRLIYHCLDVAAVGQVLLQQVLQRDDYEDILTQNITHDKKISQSLITFFVLMHDLGKFSYKFQNMNQDAVKKVNGLSSKKFYSVDHDESGFLLCQKVIWPKIWDKNWLGLDQSFDESNWQDVLKSWFLAVTMHHRRHSNIDFQNKIDNLEIYFIDENKKDACEFIEDAAKFMLYTKSEKPLLKIHKSLDYTYKYTSDLLRYLTDRSDKLVSSNRDYFNIPWTSSIEQYWTEVLRYAELAFKDAEIDSSEVIEFNQYFFRKSDPRLQGITLINKAKDHIENRRINEALDCYYRAIELFKSVNAEDLLNKYEPELRRLELNKDKYSETKAFPTPDIKETSNKQTNRPKISKENIDENYDRCLYEILKSLREELVISKGMPNTYFFTNKQLKDMATDFPQDKQSFIRMFREGKKVIEFGELFLKEIVTYCKVNNIEQKINSERDYPHELQEILELCIKCLNLKEIYAEKKDLPERKIIRYIEQLILCGAEIPIDKFVKAKNKDKILETISDSEIGDKSVAKIETKLYNCCITTEEIRFVRANKIRNNK